MPSVFEKLNLKDQKSILVLNSPVSFEPELGKLSKVTVLRNSQESAGIDFALAFVTNQKQVDTLGKVIAKKAEGDAVVWFAYPKGSSKKYKSEINRDSGWQVLGNAGFEPVRMIAIDEDWSAIRFRRVDYIKKMKRSIAMTEKGKARLAKK